MATTSPDNLYSPNSNDPYALVQDLGAMQSSVQNALIERANAYRGTTAQRNAFTNAPVGTIWSDTNGDRLVWKKGATEWEAIVDVPDEEDTGWLSLPGSPTGGVSITYAEYRIRNGVAFVRISVTGGVASGGQEVWTNLPSSLRPDRSVVGAAWLSSNYPGTLYIRTNGTIAIHQNTGSSRNTAHTYISYVL